MILPSVLLAFPSFTERFEDRIPWMYRDEKGFVTTGVGNLIDSASMACTLPWVHADGTPALGAEIIAEWWRVKSLPANQTAEHYRGALHLTEAAITTTVLRQMEAIGTALAAFWKDWATFPAEVQQALLSMAWALGTGTVRPGLCSREWPKLQQAVHDRNWAECAAQCWITTIRPGGRNEANVALFKMAAAAAA